MLLCFLNENLTKNTALTLSLAKRDIASRYKGSIIGIIWPFLNPLFMLLVYTFVFGTIFNSRWNVDSGNDSQFALLLFIGLIVFNFYAECINRSPLLMFANVNYIKKVVFPLEVLPVVLVISGMFHALISILVWLFIYAVFFGIPHITIIYIPIIIIPFVFVLMGFTWFLSSLGAYIKDIAQIVGVITSALMFLSPVFFPVDSLPLKFRIIVEYNPLTFPIEELRNLMFYGINPNWLTLIKYYLASIVIMLLGFIFFSKVKRGFSDVI